MRSTQLQGRLRPSPGVELDTSKACAERSVWPPAISGRLAATCACWLLLTAAAAAQTPEPEPDAAIENAGDTPRSTFTRFFELARQADFSGAAKFLELPADVSEPQAAQLARRLKLVLDHHKYFDSTEISAAADGNTRDGLANNVDEIARVPFGHGLQAPVRLVKRGGSWRFSLATVQRIDTWYELLPHRLWLGGLPDPLLRSGPYGLLYAQWLALPLFLCAVWIIGLGLGRGSRALLRPFAKRTRTTWDDALLGRMASPVRVAFGLIAADLLLPLLGLVPHVEAFCHKAVRATLVATFFWGVSRSIDVGGQLLSRSSLVRGAPATSAMLVFGSRLGKTVVAAFALVALFSELGYPVTSLIAGLGVGGIAVALAAQKSLENLIGAFALAVDQPFREGDLVRVDSVLGTVELIGMRATRIRTADRTLISIPNGKLAEMRIETLAARDRLRLGFTFGLSYETTPMQLRTVLDRMEAMLEQHPRLWPDTASVRFIELAESALNIEVGCVFATADGDEFALLRQEVLLGLMQIVEDSGARFALPTRTVQLASQLPPEAVSGVMARPA